MEGTMNINVHGFLKYEWWANWFIYKLCEPKSSDGQTTERISMGKKLNDNDSRGRRRWSRASVEELRWKKHLLCTGKIYEEIRRVIGFYSNLHRNCDNLNFLEKIIRIVIASRIRKVNNRNRNASEFHLCNSNLNLNPHSILPNSPSLQTVQRLIVSLGSFRIRSA